MKRLGDELRNELGRFVPDTRMVDLVAAWPDAVGPEIARNAWPARFARDGTLHVAAASSAWAFELGQLERTVLERLGAHLGASAPTRVRFAVGPLPEARPEDQSAPRAQAAVPGPTEAKEALDIASSIESEELREAAAKAAARGLAAARGRPTGLVD